MFRTPVLLMLMTLLTAVLAGCVTDEGERDDAPDGGTDGDADGETDGEASGQDGTSQAQMGTMTAYVKDAATDEFSEIWIRFDTVTVHRAGDEAEANGTANETDEEEGGSWVTVFDGDRLLDLLRFSEAESRAFLGSEDLVAGNYTQIRINVTEAWGIRISDGENVTITVAQTEAKVIHRFAIHANTTTQLIIDLDLDRSLVQQGGPQGQGGGWRMTPVIGSVQVERVEDDPQEDVPDDE